MVIVNLSFTDDGEWSDGGGYEGQWAGHVNFKMNGDRTYRIIRSIIWSVDTMY